MVTSVADIAKEAFDGVAAELGGVIKPANLTRDVRTGYNAASGVVASASVSQRCRVVFGSGTRIGDVVAKTFPDVTVMPPDQLCYLEGCQNFIPQQGDEFVTDDNQGTRWTIQQSLNLLLTGGLHIAIARPA